MEFIGKSEEKVGIKRAVIGEDFSQTVLALTEEILPSGHIALAFAQEDTALANRTEAALNLQKYKIGRYSYASGTTPSREAAEDLENCPESVRLLICCGEADMADIVKFAAWRRGIPWLLVPSSPDILPCALPLAVLGWGASAERVECAPPAAIAACEGDMNGCSGRGKAAAYGSLAAERLHCLELRCEELLFGARTDRLGVKEAGELCASALECDEGVRLAEFSLKAALALQRAGVKGEGSARSFARILACVSDDGRSVSENCFVAARVLGEMFSKALAFEGRDVLIPPDRVAMASSLARLCGADKSSLVAKLEKGGDFERTAYVFGEYREDMLEMFKAAGKGSRVRARRFRRMYEDAGFWLGKYVRPQDLIRLANIFLAVAPRKSLAGAIADMNLWGVS